MGVSCDRVAIQIAKSVDSRLVYLAAIRVDMVCLPLNRVYVVEEVRYFFADTEPRQLTARPRSDAMLQAVVSDFGIAAVRMLGIAGDGSLLDGIATLSLAFADVPRGSDALAAILYTSGMTGRSKENRLTRPICATGRRHCVPRGALADPARTA